ncbi:hypothetical protein ACQP25_27230 [Microtetraspora malaysiensis]|uniref:hypothetical protein n=1 Tax=Microtetraspora malaysiensis TaxID=161358 RepID=UPI003D8B6E74
MRRYRLWWFAAPVAALHVSAAVVLGVVALVTGDAVPLVRLVAYGTALSMGPVPWWPVVPLILVAAYQGWALWQILRGRVRGPVTAGGGAVRALRVTLYLAAAFSVLELFPVILPWWAELAGAAVRLALVVLFFVVLRGASRVMATVALVAGTLAAVSGIARTAADALGARLLAEISAVAGLGGLSWALWTVLTLLAQARDGRWARATVWTGAASLVVSFLIGSLIFHLSLASNGEMTVLFIGLGRLADPLMAVWQARSAHDLGSPPRTVAPTMTLVSARPPLRSRLAAVAAIVLPLPPVVVTFWYDMPRWMVSSWSMMFFGDGPDLAELLLSWVVDLLMDMGGLPLLVLVAVLRRTPGLLRATAWVLLAAAVAGVAAALAGGSAPGAFPRRYADYSALEPGDVPAGVSPLWFGVGYAASALLLMWLAGGVGRSRLWGVVTAAATAGLLGFLPAADHAGGRVTAEANCAPLGGPRGGGEQPEPAPEAAFVCQVRQSRVFKVAPETPDRFVVDYGRRLCDVYTRDDPAELARVRRTDGVAVREVSYLLADICPRAAAVVRAANERQEREFQEWEAAERRKCAEAPRHRPLIRPVAVVVRPEPAWTDYGDLEAYEPETAEGDPGGDLPYEDDVLSAGPGHLVVHTHPDFTLCVTTETYRRRPPVETRGWDHVVEAGYLSADELVFQDPLGGPTLPDLAVRGAGHYRVRVHYAMRGSHGGGDDVQRLLIMAYPGRGDDVVVHRKRATR